MKEKDNALLKWSLHLLNTRRNSTKNKLHILILKIISTRLPVQSLESPTPKDWSLWPITKSPGLETRVSRGDQNLDQDISEFHGYGPLDDQGSPDGQGKDQN
jgi:hypothetical protein